MNIRAFRIGIYAHSVATALFGFVLQSTAQPTPREPNPLFASTTEWYGHVEVTIEGGGTQIRRSSLTSHEYRVSHRAVIDFRVSIDPKVVAAMQQVTTAAQRMPSMASVGQVAKQRVFYSNPKAPNEMVDLQIDDREVGTITEIGEGKSPDDPETTTTESHTTGMRNGLDKSGLSGSYLFLNLEAQTYDLHVTWDDVLPVTVVGNVPNPPATELTTNLHLDVERAPLPETGEKISGSRSLTPEELGPFHRGHGRLRGNISWQLTLKPPPMPVLIVTIPEYNSWLPAGTAKETVPGNLLEVYAFLRGPDGLLSTKACKSMTFKLTDISAQPGTCLNFPVNGQTSDDLKFEARQNPRLQIKDNGRTAIATDTGARAVATLSCFDWGAWGAVTVTAVLDTGETVVGRSDETGKLGPILLPKRAEDSKIGDAWKKGKPYESYPDDDDSEKTPMNNNDGDGLSLYEEYRGFYVNGKHVRSDPTLKDLFIVDKSSTANNRASLPQQPQISAGITLFQQLSSIHAYKDVLVKELGGDRVINFNHGYAHLVDQHGVIIEKPDPNIHGGFQAVGNDAAVIYGTPKHTLHIVLAAEVFGWKPPTLPARVCGDRAVTGLAHELFHACNVRHHGDYYYDVVFEDFTFDSTTQIWSCTERNLTAPKGIRVKLMESRGVPYNVPTDWLKTNAHTFTVGTEKGGHSSGDQDCVMRDDDAAWYCDHGDFTIRYSNQSKDCTGIMLCTSPAGTGINAPGPDCRFGDADAGRGNCKAQVRVNDR